MSSSADSSDSASSARARLVEQVVAECIRRRSSGERFSDADILASHADLLPELERELQKLHLVELAHRAANGTEPLTDPGAPPPVQEVLPNKFEGYEVVHEIHHGGQGVVYLAIQKSTRRKVAIKVLHGGPFVDARARTRLEREVQILGHLDHPNIVRVHDSGVADGCPFYVMDYISGQTLDTYLAQDHHTPANLLRLFAKICDAVTAAHLCGVIHRDLKPTNIRIDAHGEPHVLDFGLAKLALEDVTDGEHPRLLSQTGQFIGSVPWAAPEQAAGLPGRIDIRTDVYALGVVLYHMLTGRMPYEVVGNVRDVLDRILHAKPQRPSTVVRAACRQGGSSSLRPLNFVASSLRRSRARGLDDELDTIVLKCLAKERERRYQSAGELARDVRHYLAGEPIEAKRDSLAYVLRKQLHRYRLPAAVAAAFVLVVTVGFFTSLALWRQAARERETARRHAQRAELVAEFLDNVLTSVDPEAAEVDRDSPLYRALRSTLDNAAGRADRLADQPEVEARVRYTLGRVYMNLGLYAEGEQHLRRAADLRRAVLGAGHVQTGDTLFLLGWSCKEQGRYAEALAAYQEALDIRTRLFGRESLPVAEVFNGLGQLYFDQKDYPRAEPYLRDALALRARLDDDPGDVANSLANLGSLLRDAARLDEAEPLLRKALEMRRAALGETHHETLVSLNKLALLLRLKGESAAARQMFEQYVAQARAVLGEQHAHVAVGLTNLGLTLFDDGEYAQAADYFRQALGLFSRARGETHPQVAEALLNLGAALRMQGDTAGATENCTRAFEMLATTDPRRARALLLRGQLLLEAGDARGALSSLQEAAQICSDRFGATHPETQRIQRVLADCEHALAP
jgi:serine/threonine protein kinase/Tfp pilus assembly protein PilF